MKKWLKQRPKNSEKANLIIISFDQWRGDWGGSDKPIVKLETMERIAKSGLTMNKCYTNSPQCVPARFSWITGLEPSQLGVTKNENITLPINVPSKIRDLQDKGWYTAIVGKTHWSTHNVARDLREDKEHIKRLGFNDVLEIAGPRALQIIECELTDDWKTEGYLEKQRDDLKERYRGINIQEAWKSRKTILPNHLYPDIWITIQAQNKIAKLPSDRPWILWISFVGPHEPFDTPEPWRGSTKDMELPRAIKKRKWIGKLQRNCELSVIDKKWADKMTEEQVKELRKDYADHLKLLDDQVGIIINQLEQRSDFKRTAITVMSDHGEMLGDGGMLYKSTFLESSIHVPMIFRKPNGEQNARTHKKPVNLTGTLMKILDSLEEGGDSKVIRSWAEKEEGAIIEFGKERAFVKGGKKICMDYSGKVLWATDITKDPEEIINQAEIVTNMERKKWQQIIAWARKVTKSRNKKEWVWKDLIKHRYDQT